MIVLVALDQTPFERAAELSLAVVAAHTHLPTTTRMSTAVFAHTSVASSHHPPFPPRALLANTDKVHVVLEPELEMGKGDSFAGGSEAASLMSGEGSAESTILSRWSYSDEVNTII